MQQELKRTGGTLMLRWEEYATGSIDKALIPMLTSSHGQKPQIALPCLRLAEPLIPQNGAVCGFPLHCDAVDKNSLVSLRSIDAAAAVSSVIAAVAPLTTI